ncbi:MAG: hypothetical protein RL077_4026, partial [Verrucomicrobiota bacterium]
MLMKTLRQLLGFSILKRLLLTAAGALLSGGHPASAQAPAIGISAPRGAAATGAIAGRVQNEVTGKYLNKARITIPGTTLTTFTD